MDDRTAKGIILSKVREALLNQTPQPYPDVDSNARFFHPSEESVEVQFAEAFTDLNGQFAFCADLRECMELLKELTAQKGWEQVYVWDHFLQELFIRHDYRQAKVGRNLDKADAGVTLCEALISRTGSILLSSKLASGRSLNIFPPVHIVIAFMDQLVPDLADGIRLMKEKYEQKLPSLIYFATGPSRTADIEKTLVLGAHGPKEVYLFLIDKRP